MRPFTPPYLGNARRWAGLKVGLFGGSFNPPHAGHLHVCHTALKRLDLDFIWWMVTPQNPLKSRGAGANYQERMDWSRAIVRHPKILVTDIEAQLGTHVSIDTVRELKRRFPKTGFMWLTGTDNALILHKWDDWRGLQEEIGFCFVARPPALDLIKRAPVRLLSASLTMKNKWILATKTVDESSTRLRAAQ